MKFKFNSYAAWLTTALLALVLLCCVSCSSIRKLKKNVKQTEDIKTSEQTSKSKDSSVTTVTKAIDSSGTTITMVFEYDGKDTTTDVEITTFPPTKNDYNTGRKVGVKSNRKLKSLTVNQADKKAEEKAVASNVKTSDTKNATTEKKTTTQVKTQEKQRFSFNWLWLLWLIPLIIYGLYKMYPKPFLNVFTKLKNITGMKSILFIALSAILFFGCIAPDKENTTVEERQSLMRPDNPLDWEIIYKDTTGMKAVLINGQYVEEKSTWQKQVKIPRSTFWLTMSSKQVKHFMHASNYFATSLLLGVLVSIIIIVLAVLFIKGDWMRFMGKGGALGFILVAAIGINFRIYQKRPSELAANNVKQLSRAEYERWLKVDPTWNKFWQEKWEKNELVGLTNKASAK